MGRLPARTGHRSCRSTAADTPRPSPRPASTGRSPAQSGEVDAALAETMRLPGASQCSASGSCRARRYISARTVPWTKLNPAALLGVAISLDPPLPADDRLGKQSPRFAKSCRCKPRFSVWC